MTLPKKQQVVILNLLEKQMSFSQIQKKCREKGFSVSKCTLSRYKKNNIPILNPTKQKVGVGRKLTLSNHDLGRLKKMISNINPPTINFMANRLEVSQNVIRYAIKKKIGKKLVMKPKGQVLSEQMIEKRHNRSWKMYNLLKCDKWKIFVSVDEAWFYLSNADGQRPVQYISHEKTKKDASVFTKTAHPKGVMVFMGVSYNGLTKPIFVKPGAKINSDYYINECLKPLFEEVKTLYPNGTWIFHQDSAPSHTSKKTLAYIRNEGVNFVQPSQWCPNSPDLAPCDFFLWGYLKTMICQQKVDTIKKLKKLILRAVQKVPLNLVHRALKSWPKRCRQCYYNKGKHFEFN